jgi:hypothetical protein
MTPYAQLPTHNPEEFIRTVGLSQEDFRHLSGKLAAYLDEQKALNPLTRRGRKTPRLALEDRLLLTLYYLYHYYPTLINLAKKKGQPLSVEYKAHNKALSKQRVFIEHVNSRCKIFRIVKDVYRGKHKNYSLTWNLSC